jgi:hypothetical protein
MACASRCRNSAKHGTQRARRARDVGLGYIRSKSPARNGEAARLSCHVSHQQAAWHRSTEIRPCHTGKPQRAGVALPECVDGAVAQRGKKIHVSKIDLQIIEANIHA